MAKKKQNVWVASYRYEDRHCDGGMSIIGVFSTKKKAEKACADNIEDYLKACDGIKDGKITDAIDEIDGEPAEGMTVADALKATSINVDSSGTWCEWNIDEKEVE